jgi:hypothetical protein
MANRHRGEIEADIGGARRRLVLTLGARKPSGPRAKSFRWVRRTFRRRQNERAHSIRDRGVISAPAYFPLGPGGLGAAGEAGPEAILPLARGRDGRPGVATSSVGSAANVSVHITTPNVETSPDRSPGRLRADSVAFERVSAGTFLRTQVRRYRFHADT